MCRLAWRVIAEEDSRVYSISLRICPSVGLCLTEAFAFFLESRTIWPGRGSPILSRAISLTAVTARKVFFFFDFAILKSLAQQHFAAWRVLWNN